MDIDKLLEVLSTRTQCPAEQVHRLQFLRPIFHQFFLFLSLSDVDLWVFMMERSSYPELGFDKCGLRRRIAVTLFGVSSIKDFSLLTDSEGLINKLILVSASIFASKLISLHCLCAYQLKYLSLSRRAAMVLSLGYCFVWAQKAPHKCSVCYEPSLISH